MTTLTDNPRFADETFAKCKMSSHSVLLNSFASGNANSFPAPYFLQQIFGTITKRGQAEKMGNEYLARLNFLEVVAVDKLMKMRLEKME